jgi:hypothetical protein
MGLSPSAFVIGPNSFENDIRSDRKVVELLAGGLSGVQDAAAFAVSPVSGQHQISIAGGVGTLAGRSTPASQGSYLVWSDAADVVALPAVQSNPFIVAVVLRVADPQYGVVSGTVGARYDLVPGTAAASPVAPSDSDISSYGGGVPGAWLRLADVRINTGDTGAIPAGQITDTRGYYISGGMYVVCTSATRPPHKVSRLIYETDTKLSYISNGSAWNQYGYPTTHARFVTTSQLSHGATTWNLMPIDSKVDVIGEDVLSVSGREVTVPPGLWSFDAAITMNGTNFIPRIDNGSGVLARGSKVTSGNEGTITVVRRLTSTGLISLKVHGDGVLQNLVASNTIPFHLSVTRLA